MLISVIICCHNSENKLIQCLTKLDDALKVMAEINTEVIVVDNNSTDNTKKIALSCFSNLCAAKYRLIVESKSGLTYARLSGINAAVGEFICFLDDDNWASADYFRTVIATFQKQSKVGFFGCSTRLPNDRSFPPDVAPFAKQFAVGDLYQISGLLAAYQVVWGAGFAARSSALKSVLNSGFKPILLGRSGAVQLAGDDYELGYALAIAGWRVWYQCEPLIEHAIDIKRMNYQKLKEMYCGFGASNSVLLRYSLYLKGRKRTALTFYPFWYIYQLVKIFVRLWHSKVFLPKSNDVELRLIFYRESLRCYLVNIKNRTNQTNNILSLTNKCCAINALLND